ncbi:hypothetical protein E2562_006474 [Oryza meyeriana var. granulata]|uniref:Myb/SANT-like DNA-binding domain-containing protein n=1 Tax=Oryza meyeriana var. granulata TaxID=110450 RepID=A0A6G1CN02_9ORYZ|nr:hypothetical protein E2562_006474 [Oryza meyeriana var. granulata]
MDPPSPAEDFGRRAADRGGKVRNRLGMKNVSVPAPSRPRGSSPAPPPASSWLNASKDPIKGNDKKGDTFWKEVTDEFNKKGNGKRTREMNQLKIHWSRLKASISDFNGFWTKVGQVYTSGYSDDMLEEEAHKMYANKFGKRFLLVHWWKILKDEPKWCAQFETENNKSEIVDVPDEESRPIGREAAKAELSGKRKKDNILEGIVILGDNIAKIVKMSEENDNPDVCQNPMYSLDEFLAEDEILDDVLNEATVVIQSTIEALQKEGSDHRFHPRKHIKRPREEAHEKLGTPVSAIGEADPGWGSEKLARLAPKEFSAY